MYNIIRILTYFIYAQLVPKLVPLLSDRAGIQIVHWLPKRPQLGAGSQSPWRKGKSKTSFEDLRDVKRCI